MRQNRRASSIINRLLVILIILASGSLLYYKNSQQFTQVDRACIQDEWQKNDDLNETDAITDSTYLVSFSDVQKEFRWLYTPELTGSPEILMIISTNCDNFARRNILRKTWMAAEKNQIISGGRMKVLFLVGVDSKIEATNTVVMKEAEVFGDMIVIDAEDSYENLPWKSISLLLYGILKTPPSVQLIGKIDEDVIFYPDQLTDLISDGTINATSLSIYGEKWEGGVAVNHDEKSKWHVPKSSYSCRVYPSYLSGPFYLTTRKAAERIIKFTKHRKFISVEDIFITGLLAGDVGVEKRKLSSLYMVDGATSNHEKFEILAWHTAKNNQKFLESWENLRLSRCKGCRRYRNYRGSKSQIGETDS